VNCRYDVFPRHGCRKAPKSRKVETVFIDFNCKNRNRSRKFLH